MATLGNFLRESRNYAGYSQSSLSRKTGINLAYLNMIENDKKIPSTTILRKICDATKADYDKAYFIYKQTKGE